MMNPVPVLNVYKNSHQDLSLVFHRDSIPVMVPGTGLEPARLAAHGPKPCASANSAIRAFHQYKLALGLAIRLFSRHQLCGRVIRYLFRIMQYTQTTRHLSEFAWR
jgi:hypothetical protein